MATKSNMPATSDADKTAMAAVDAMFGKSEADPTLVKGDEKPEEKDEDEEQKKANGGKQEKGAEILSKKEDCKKSDDEDEDDEKDDDEDKPSKAESEGKDVSEGAEKSMVSEDDLLKAIDLAETLAKGGTVEKDRKAELAEKFAKSETTPEESAELLDLVKAATEKPAQGTLEKSFADQVVEDPDITAGHTDEGFDVSGYLARHAVFVANGLDAIGDRMSKSFSSLGEYNQAAMRVNRALAMTIVKQGELIKSMGDRLEQIEKQPVGRISVPTAHALAKSSRVSGDAPSWTRADVANGFMQLQKSSATGSAPCGRDIAYDQCEYETSGQIHPDMQRDLSKVIR